MLNLNDNFVLSILLFAVLFTTLLLIKKLYELIICLDVYEDWIIAANTSQDNIDEVSDDLPTDTDPADSGS